MIYKTYCQATPDEIEFFGLHKDNKGVFYYTEMPRTIDEQIEDYIYS